MRKWTFILSLCILSILGFIVSENSTYAKDEAALDERIERCRDKEPGDICEFQGEEGLCTKEYASFASQAACTGDPQGLDGFFEDAGTGPANEGAVRQSINKLQACDNGEDIGTECSFQQFIPSKGDVDGICARGDGSTENNDTKLLTEGRLFCHYNIEDSDWDCQDYSQAGDRCYSVEFDEVGRCESDGEESLTCNTEYGDRESGDTFTECGDNEVCADSESCVENPANPDQIICLERSNSCGQAASACDAEEACVVNPSDPEAGGGICQSKAGTEKTVPDTPGAGDGDGDGGGGFTRPEPEDITFRNPIVFETIPELLAGLIRSALGLLAAVTTVILVISGFKYMVAGSPSGVQSALGGIKNAVIGLVIIMGSFLLTEYVISALLS